MLICPTFAHNKTYHRIGENDPRMFVITCEQHDVEICLENVRLLFEGTNTLIILDPPLNFEFLTVSDLFRAILYKDNAAKKTD